MNSLDNSPGKECWPWSLGGAEADQHEGAVAVAGSVWQEDGVGAGGGQGLKGCSSAGVT